MDLKCIVCGIFQMSLLVSGVAEAAPEPSGNYTCALAQSVFALEVFEDGKCTTKSWTDINAAPQSCDYQLSKSGDLEIRSQAIWEINRYVLRYVPVGQSGTKPDMRGPGLEALQAHFDLLSDDPSPETAFQSRGWCAKQ